MFNKDHTRCLTTFAEVMGLEPDADLKSLPLRCNCSNLKQQKLK